MANSVKACFSRVLVYYKTTEELGLAPGIEVTEGADKHGKGQRFVDSRTVGYYPTIPISAFCILWESGVLI